MSVADVKLEKMTHHVLNARAVVERQRRLIAIQTANGHDTQLAEQLLDRTQTHPSERRVLEQAALAKLR